METSFGTLRPATLCGDVMWHVTPGISLWRRHVARYARHLSVETSCGTLRPASLCGDVIWHVTPGHLSVETSCGTLRPASLCGDVMWHVTADISLWRHHLARYGPGISLWRRH
ncbi:hypothetical protein BaRGS_00012727 [Batillaria attramentaria]|uniref:Uncharacterized protein n=1 Tax=Batillaria attramentaria TaxID=370345 RepID=A0ABD0L9Q8_9CAEN